VAVTVCSTPGGSVQLERQTVPVASYLPGMATAPA
jgi:hypothetical protein